MSEMNANWNYPNNIRVGAGRIRELPDLCRQLGLQAPLIITDPGLSPLPMLQDAATACTDAGLNCSIFNGVQGNPTKENVEDGVAFYRANGHDGVIAFGGGSALDAGKAVALMVGQRRPLWDFEDIGDNWTRADQTGIAPVVAVPTTAGTGSEVGRASVITDTANHIKKIIFHPKMLPSSVILDPELTCGLPPNITAATGMDALSHSLEALCSPFYHPMAEGIAIEGIRLIKEYLPRAVADGQDVEARTQMLVASSMGATAFQKGLGGMHALAHTLGALNNSHHGLLNAILMPYVLNANRTRIEEKIERLSSYLQLPEFGFEGFLNWILQLREELGIPRNLALINIDDNAAEKVGKMAAKDPTACGNPIPFDEKEYAAIFRASVHGLIS